MSQLTGLHNYNSSQCLSGTNFTIICKYIMYQCLEMKATWEWWRMDVFFQISVRDINTSTLTQSNDLLEHLHASFKFIFPINCSNAGFSFHLCACLISLLHISDSLINCAKCYLKLVITLYQIVLHTGCCLVAMESFNWSQNGSFLCLCAVLLLPSWLRKGGKAFNESKNACIEGENGAIFIAN